ncbi:ninjurin-2-like [Syngnathoides biaculeatus]|uniref:ninjurin-2-like n=1 Tax=Syngnathoides biaculeatus TaxID=300417 RepID=UPI002ADE7337|nr:ninjurin-2-like [Syngnathoides biaculeatus]
MTRRWTTETCNKCLRRERREVEGENWDDVNKPFVCASAFSPAWGNFLSYGPLPPSYFQCARLPTTGLIMQGLGKTERADQGRDMDLTSLRSTMPAGGALQGSTASNLNMNLYATKKTAAEGMLDIALFLANITHMKTVIEQGAGYRYYAAVLTLISFSLALQIIAGILIIIIARVELTLLPSYQRLLNFLNNLTTGVIFLTLLVNIIKSAFGTQRSCLLRWMFQRFVL